MEDTWKIDDFDTPYDLDSCNPCEGLRIVDEEDLEFLCDCANALAGIPTEQLPEVKKAWLASNLYSMLSSWHDDATFDMVFTLRIGKCFEQHFSRIPDIGQIVLMAKKMRSRGADFGELNALLDSIA